MDEGLDLNFTCVNKNVSRTNISDNVWWVKVSGSGHEYALVALAVGQIVISAIGVPWNAIVLAIIALKRRYKDPAHMLLFNLVLVDFLLLLVLPMNIKSTINRGFDMGESDFVRCQVCLGIGVSITTLKLISIFTLMWMSLERLLYVKWPFHYQMYLSAKRVLFLIILTWVLGILASLLPLVRFGEIRLLNSLSVCTVLSAGENTLTKNIYYFVFLVMLGVLPYSISLGANTWLLIIAWKSRSGKYRNKIGAVELNQIPPSKLRKEQSHLAQVFGAIFITNAITWMPIIAAAPVQVVLGSENVPEGVYALVYLSIMVQSAIHPMLETCLIGKGRELVCTSLRSFLKKLKPRSHHHAIPGAISLQQKHTGAISLQQKHTRQ